MEKWRLIGTERIYHSEYMSVFDDRVMLPNGQEITYTRVELKDFVSILPIIQGKIVMIAIFRYPTNCYSLEIPSGYVETGEKPRESAIRELEEETGYKTEKLRSIGWYHPWTRSVRKAHLFLAENLKKGTQKLDTTEQINVKLLSINKTREKIENGEITHAPTIIALQRFLLTRQ